MQSKETNRQIGPLDDKVGHYVKILCDEIFGREHFINDITRIKCNPKNFKRKAYGNVKDRILFYVKSNQYVWNEVPYSHNVTLKARQIKEAGLWLDVRNQYVRLKEMYLSRRWDKDHPSFVVYIEARVSVNHSETFIHRFIFQYPCHINSPLPFLIQPESGSCLVPVQRPPRLTFFCTNIILSISFFFRL